MYITRLSCPLTSTITSKRNFYRWINKVFNQVDEQRRKEVGPDRSCAEWLLRNGAYVKWHNENDFVTHYNDLPEDDFTPHIVEIDATDSSVMHYGFAHFEGCNHIKKIIFCKCYYLQDKALKDLSLLKNSLSYLQICQCYEITEAGLHHLTALSNLQELVLAHLPYVKDKQKIVDELQNSLPKCSIQFN